MGYSIETKYQQSILDLLREMLMHPDTEIKDGKLNHKTFKGTSKIPQYSGHIYIYWVTNPEINFYFCISRKETSNKDPEHRIDALYNYEMFFSVRDDFTGKTWFRMVEKVIKEGGDFLKLNPFVPEMYKIETLIINEILKLKNSKKE